MLTEGAAIIAMRESGIRHAGQQVFSLYIIQII
jgi:hypothetical protein